jgi:shikimate kinase
MDADLQTVGSGFDRNDDEGAGDPGETPPESSGAPESAGDGRGSSIVLVGGMGSGKSTVGWLLARFIGYGFIDMDEAVEQRIGRKVHEIFARDGEGAFRKAEADAIAKLTDVRTHVIAVGGGALMNEANWAQLRRVGWLVWLNPPAHELARRLGVSDAELTKRPLLAELAGEGDRAERVKRLEERLAALVGQRTDRYKLADLVVTDSFSTPESTAHAIKDALLNAGRLRKIEGDSLADRWRIN